MGHMTRILKLANAAEGDQQHALLKEAAMYAGLLGYKGKAAEELIILKFFQVKEEATRTQTKENDCTTSCDEA